MITYTSTPDEIRRECAAIDRHLEKKYVKAFKVFRNWVKNNRRQGHIVLSNTVYTINNNRVHVFWSGMGYANRNDIAYCFYVECPNKSGQLRYIFFAPKQSLPGYKPIGSRVFVFTHHFCQRLQERLGVSFIQWFEEWVKRYSLCFWHSNKNEKNQIMAMMNNTYCMGVEVKENYYYMTTCINMAQHFSNQMEEHLEKYRNVLDFEKAYHSFCDMLPKQSYSETIRQLREAR